MHIRKGNGLFSTFNSVSLYSIFIIKQTLSCAIWHMQILLSVIFESLNLFQAKTISHIKLLINRPKLSVNLFPNLRDIIKSKAWHKSKVWLFVLIWEFKKFSAYRKKTWHPEIEKNSNILPFFKENENGSIGRKVNKLVVLLK